VIWSVNDGWHKLVLKYESLNSVHCVPEQQQNRDVLYPAPLDHLPEPCVISGVVVKASFDSLTTDYLPQ